MQKIGKAKNMADKLELSPSNDYPGTFVYNSPIGELSYRISAREAESVYDSMREEHNSEIVDADDIVGMARKRKHYDDEYSVLNKIQDN